MENTLTHQINDYDSLVLEKERLKSMLHQHEYYLKEDVHALKDKIKPLNIAMLALPMLAIPFFSNKLIGTGVTMGVSALANKFIPDSFQGAYSPYRKPQSIQSQILPILAKTIAPALIGVLVGRLIAGKRK